MKKRYVFAGASARGRDMFMKPMRDELGDYCELAGVYDINPGRTQVVSEQTGIPAFDDFEDMIQKTRPDTVIVTTVDAYHSDYIIRSMELGCDVITEKPMTTDADKCRAILEAEQKTGKKVLVTFNYRYAPFMTKIKQLMCDGLAGDVFSVHFEWLLDRNMDIYAHGTSYFRRWNARMAKSGGLLVHKSTHHFDLVNWWIGQKPGLVSAFGRLNLYGKPGREKYAGGIQGRCCRDCAFTERCGFRTKLGADALRLYAENERYDGYVKDGCIYSDEIDIYDTMSVNVAYSGGAMLTYSLNATCPYEGWRVAVNGSKGRLEAFMPEMGVSSKGLSDTITFYDLQNNITQYHVTKVSDGHNGGDERLRRMLFVGDVPDPLGHNAGSEAGRDSIIIGAAANLSIRENRIVSIAELMGDL